MSAAGDPPSPNASDSTAPAIASMVGRFSPEQSEALRMALRRAEMEPHGVADAAAAMRALASTETVPSMVLIDASMVELEPLITWLRGQAHLFGAMVVAVVPAPTETAFREAIAAGCDDVVVQGDLGGVTRRGAVLVRYDPRQRPPLSQGTAMVAHPLVARRLLLGRILRLAGFDVAFAASAAEVEEAVGRSTPSLMVVAASLPPRGPLHAIAEARRLTGESELVSIVVATEGELRTLDAMNGVGWVDELGAPDALLFVANELLRPGVQNLRASRRLLADSLCAFRPAGQLHPVVGLTYNLSREGLYVRTLDPPPPGVDLWFELRPPGAREVVHLRGRVVWVRSAERGPGGSAPPGFGVRIDEAACPPADFARYCEAYDAAVAD